MLLDLHTFAFSKETAGASLEHTLSTLDGEIWQEPVLKPLPLGTLRM